MEDHRPVVGNFKLERDEHDRLVLVDETGFRYVGVEAVRAFPISDPQHAISICDVRGRELAYLPAWDTIPSGIRETLETELSQREFVPIIRRILNHPHDAEPAEWKVETDRGVTVFQLESGNDLHRRDPNQVMVVDSHGIRYLIPDITKLDAHSRRMLDRFL